MARQPPRLRSAAWGLLRQQARGIENAYSGGNDRFYIGAGLQDHASAELRPVEADVFDRFGDELRGRALDVGCGAGRLVGELLTLGLDVCGIDISPTMVQHCRRSYPDAEFVQGDMRKIGHGAVEGSFDVVIASFNVLDAVGDADRRWTLEGIAEVTAPGGLLIMSSHNRGFAPRVHSPIGEMLAKLREGRIRPFAASVIRLPRRLRNHRRLRGGQVSTPGYEILNDAAHDYSLLHLYISRDEQERQLQEHGFELLECLDPAGRCVQHGQLAPAASELHYVARRRTAPREPGLAALA